MDKETPRQQALRLAKEETTRTKRKYVVREDYGRYHVVPLYERNGEGQRHDPGYAALGTLVQESM